MKVKRTIVIENQNQIYQTFGELVANGRNAANLSQRELAAIVGISRSSVNSVERGQQHLLVGDAVMISKLLGINLDELNFPGIKGHRQMRTWGLKRLHDFHKQLEITRAIAKENRS